MHYCDTFLCTHGSCSKSFWDLPLVEGPERHVHPKTTTFCPVLGFTPSGRPSRAHQSQNDLEQRYSGPFVHLPVFLTCNVRMKNGLPRWFCSWRVTLGNSQPAFQAPLWHLPVFRTCNVRTKIGLPRRFCSWRVTSGRRKGGKGGCKKARKEAWERNRRKYIPICNLEIADLDSSIIVNYEKVTPILIIS